MIPPIETAGVALTANAASAERARAAEERAEESPARDRLWKIGAVAAQVGALLLVIQRFEIESRAFHQVAALALGGFLVHALLPLRYRLPFFLALSIASVVIVLGPASGGWLLALGTVLIAVTRLPIAFRSRLLLLALLGVGLALQRMERLPAPWSGVIWPILGSMFMFRLLVYLYDLKHETARPSLLSTFSYFFLLPNVCFPFFPVVDFKTFRRSHYVGDECRTYQIGAHWMIRGVAHLLVYRIIYTSLALDPADVRGPFELAQFLLTNFLLYLRVSGQFHLIVGVLHLFGFNLPETNHHYLLSSSFTDFWRRINIYWKDFMMKVFYYPLYFALKKRGATFALVAATAGVFVVTWLLHSYQWFWVRGTFPLTVQDVLFWGILCALVIVNSLNETRHGRKRTLGGRSVTLRERLAAALKTIGILAAICLLWSLWTSDSLTSWASLWTLGLKEPATGTAPIAPWVVAALAAVGCGGALAAARPKGALRVYSFRRHALLSGCAILALLVISMRHVNVHFGPLAAGVVQSLRSPQLSRRDEALMQRGYYENLLDVNRFNTQLWEVFMRRPRMPLLHEMPVGRESDDIYKSVLLPSVTMPYRGGTLTTNRWAMRDRDYAEEKPAGVYRIVILGASHAMGAGVSDAETFENVMEDRLNAEAESGGPTHYEILNFAVAGYSPIQRVATLDDRVWRFQPDAVFYVAHACDHVDAVRRLGEMVGEGVELRYDELRSVVERAGVTRKTNPTVGMARLEPFGDELIAWVYRRIAEESRRHGARPVWIFLPRVQRESPEETAMLASHARSAGFRLIDLSDTYDGRNLESLYIAEWDRHPTAAGQQLIADRLLGALRDGGDVIPLPPTLTTPRDGTGSAGFRQPGESRDGRDSQDGEEVHTR